MTGGGRVCPRTHFLDLSWVQQEAMQEVFIMMTVSEFSSQGGVPPHVVRYYSRIGLLNPSRHPDNGYKLFTRSDIGRLRFIRHARSLGYTLEEISEILDTCRRGESPCARVRNLLARRIEENRRKIRELAALQERMEYALESWKAIPDRDPEGGSLCHLIESTESVPANA
jgi:MerR family Zn(II)-responsive transcriptional regulator of zntA